MLIGVTGDTHNNLKNISEICRIFNEIKPHLVIHTGDITLPKSLKAFSALNMPLIGVFGNNDQMEKDGLIIESKKFDCNVYDEPYILTLKNKKIYVFHHPDLISSKVISSADFIVHGHTHRFRDEIFKNTHIFNPGECAGMMKGMNKIGIIDTKGPSMEIISF